MCLSTVYKGVKSPETIVLRNVTQIECKDDCIILTDLMDHSVVVQGKLVSANLVDGYVIVEEYQE